MKATREERLDSDSGKGGFPIRPVLLFLAIIVVGVLIWQSITKPSVQPPPEPVVVATVVPEPPPLPPAKDIPPRPEPVVEVAAETPPEPAPGLPALADSDAMLREQLAAAGVGPVLDGLEQQQNLIQQETALIDGFSRGLVLRKMLPLDPPKGAFSVLEQGEEMFLNPASYERYNDYAVAIATLDASAMIDTFHTMRPLYEQAYGLLGLNPDDFDNAVIRTLDRILSTPEIDGPIALTRKSVMYKYADPQLEQLSPLQKQLLRMGPDNLRQIKEQARALRAGLLSEQ